MSSDSRIPAQPQDAFNDFARVVADQQLGVVLDLPERVDPERLALAVAALIENQPVLGCRFVADGRAAWHEPVRGAADAALRTVDDADSWRRALVEAAQPLGEGDAHLSVVSVRGETHDALAVRVDHTAADGQGVKATVELLAAAYSGGLPGTVAGAPGPDRSCRRLRRQAGLSRMVVAAVRRKEAPPTWGLPAAGGHGGSRRHELVTLSAADSTALRAWGRSQGFTINDLILAGFYRSVFSMLEPPEGSPMVVRVSFDQRRYLPPDDPMPPASNLSSVEPVMLARIADETFEATAARARAQMDALKASSPGLGSALLLELLYRLLGYARLRDAQVAGMERGQRAGRTYPFLSNFGVLDPARLVLGDIVATRAVVLPVAGHPPFAMLGASSYLGELTLSMGYAEGELDGAVARTLVAGIVDELREVAEWASLV